MKLTRGRGNVVVKEEKYVLRSRPKQRCCLRHLKGVRRNCFARTRPVFLLFALPHPLLLPSVTTQKPHPTRTGTCTSVGATVMDANGRARCCFPSRGTLSQPPARTPSRNYGPTVQRRRDNNSKPWTGFDCTGDTDGTGGKTASGKTPDRASAWKTDGNELGAASSVPDES